MNYVEQKNQKTKEYVLHDFIYLKFQNTQNKVMIKIKLVTPGIGKKLGELLG